MKAPVEVTIHPTSAELIEKGHFWITEDSFTIRFPFAEPLLIGKHKGKKVCVFLHDPHHKTIKGRVWSLGDKIQFEKELAERISIAIKNRSGLLEERENYYLFFGEGDSLPGLFAIRLKDTILLQYFSTFWRPFTKTIIAQLKKEVPGITSVWLQERGIGEQKPPQIADGERNPLFNIQEFGVNYSLSLTNYYDHGLYTDMASLRKKLGPELKEKKVLNLYCYTGAISLFALKSGASQVVSVDLSKPYLEWLDKNMKLNPDLDATKHVSLNMSVQDALKKLLKENQTFDMIICDPPSASSDGKKITSALQEYENLLPMLVSLLNKKGKLVPFLNTHQVTLAKFEGRMKAILKDKGLEGVLKMNSHIGLGEDCPTKKGFPEGSYLKGLIYTKA
ncbi:MAG: class I SAM-dependent rRNA methyltransferase [Bacteriovoracaceae bacterium]